MDRSIPFDPNGKCDNCGALGVFDFMGDYICQQCLECKAMKFNVTSVSLLVSDVCSHATIFRENWVSCTDHFYEIETPLRLERLQRMQKMLMSQYQ
jgi:hypothetical protein